MIVWAVELGSSDAGETAVITGVTAGVGELGDGPAHRPASAVPASSTAVNTDDTRRVVDLPKESSGQAGRLSRTPRERRFPSLPSAPGIS